MTILVRWSAVPAVVETWNPREAHPRRLDIVGEPTAARPWRVRDAGSGSRPAGDTRPDTPSRPPRCQSAAATRVAFAARPNRARTTHRRRRHVIPAGRNAR